MSSIDQRTERSVIGSRDAAEMKGFGQAPEPLTEDAVFFGYIIAISKRLLQILSITRSALYFMHGEHANQDERWSSDMARKNILTRS